MTPRVWTGTVATVGVLMCGCESAADDGFIWVNYQNCPTTATLSASQRATPVFESPWDKWATLATHVPGGLAGEYPIIPVGVGWPTRVGVSLVDTTQAAAALDSLAANWSIVSAKPWSFARDSITLAQARWTIIELNDWYRYIDSRYYYDARPFLNMAENRIELSLESAGKRSAMRTALIAQQVPCSLVAARVRGPVSFASSK